MDVVRAIHLDRRKEDFQDVASSLLRNGRESSMVGRKDGEVSQTVYAENHRRTNYRWLRLKSK